MSVSSVATSQGPLTRTATTLTVSREALYSSFERNKPTLRQNTGQRSHASQLYKAYLGMGSLRHDLRDAFDKAYPEPFRSATAAGKHPKIRGIQPYKIKGIPPVER